MPKPSAEATPSGEPAHLMWAKLAWEAVKSIVIGLAAVFSFLASQDSEKAKQQAEAANHTLAERSQQSQLDLKAYELVEKALSLDSIARKAHARAAAAIVNALTRPPLRDDLQDALRAGVTDPELVRQLDDARQFDADTAGFGAPTGPAQEKRSTLPSGPMSFLNPVSSAWAQDSALRGYRIDILYCEDTTRTVTAAREARANQALQRIQTSGVGATARVRLLPTLVQARPGYRSSSDEIRYDEAGALVAAQELARLINLERPPTRTDYKAPTPQYLSVFYCSGR